MRPVAQCAVLLAFGLAAATIHTLRAPLRWPDVPRDAATAPDSVRDPHSISLDEARERHSDPSVVFIDASRSDEFAAGRIPGAVSIPLAAFRGGAVPEELEWFDTDARLVVYCPTARCDAARLVAGFLRALGYRNVDVFHGGLRAWREAGLPVERS